MFSGGPSPGVAPMPTALPAPRVPLGFPPLAMAGSPATRPGIPTTPGTEAGGQTATPGDQTALGIEAGGQTTTLGGPTNKTRVACFADFGCAPHGALDPTR
jgi:hypothetical protein